MGLTENSNFDEIWNKIVDLIARKNEFLTIGERQVFSAKLASPTTITVAPRCAKGAHSITYNETKRLLDKFRQLISSEKYKPSNYYEFGVKVYILRFFRIVFEGDYGNKSKLAGINSSNKQGMKSNDDSEELQKETSSNMNIVSELNLDERHSEMFPYAIKLALDIGVDRILIEPRIKGKNSKRWVVPDILGIRKNNKKKYVIIECENSFGKIFDYGGKLDNWSKDKELIEVSEFHFVLGKKAKPREHRILEFFGEQAKRYNFDDLKRKYNIELINLVNNEN